MDNKKYSDALGTIAAFLAAHPEFDPETNEFTVTTILRYLKRKKLPITVANMETAFTHINEVVHSLNEPEPEAPETAETAEIEKYRQQISSWSSAEMKEYCKDPEVLAAVDNVLNVRPKKEQPKPAPKLAPKFKPPVKTAEERAIEGMSAEQMKRALSDPVKARGIENVLAAVAARRKQ